MQQNTIASGTPSAWLRPFGPFSELMGNFPRVPFTDPDLIKSDRLTETSVALIRNIEYIV